MTTTKPDYGVASTKF